MKKQPTYKELEKENERLRVEIRRKEDRIICLERMLFGSKSDKAPKVDSSDGPTLFDDFFKKACDEKDKAIEKAKEQIEKKPRPVAVVSRPKPKDRQNTDTPALRSGGIRKCQRTSILTIMT